MLSQGYGIGINAQTSYYGPGLYDSRCVGIFYGQYYFTDSSADSFTGSAGPFLNALMRSSLPASGLPTSNQEPSSNYNVVMVYVPTSPWTFTFQSPSSVWITDDSALATRNIVHAVLANSVWGLIPADAISLSTTSPIYVLTGQYSALGTYVLYAW